MHITKLEYKARKKGYGENGWLKFYSNELIR